MVKERAMRQYHFGPFRLDAGERRLLRDGHVVPLRPKLFDTLLVLVRQTGHLVEKNELIAAVWPDAIVEDANLAHTISMLRKVLGEREGGKPFVETVPKRGYRFVGEVRESVEPDRSVATTGSADARVAAHLHQKVQFCRTADNVQLAYATVGEGPVIVKTANWMNHLEFDWQSPVWRHLIEDLARDHRLVRYDERGNGLSDWDVADISFDAFVRDLETVVDAVGLPRFALLGISQGVAVSIAYAVRHPERVSHLVLHGGPAKGWNRMNDPGIAQRMQAIETLIRDGWGQHNSPIRQFLTSTFIPDGTPEQWAWFTELQRISTTPQNAVRLMKAIGDMDVSPLLDQVRVPTLVLHSVNDEVIPFARSRELACEIPHASFVALDSRNHLIVEHEPAWPVFRDEIRRFLNVAT
jgi:DNA-binding winged helix-turn-helix (wHTH) protein/pimeloyl-ACP methyl ester carboxylesterase